jgi:hypothetical protein
MFRLTGRHQPTLALSLGLPRSREIAAVVQSRTGAGRRIWM